MANHASPSVVDPTYPRIPLKLGKHKFELCFTYAALLVAESELKKIGHPTNILKALDFDSLDATTFVPLLYAALITHQPEFPVAQVPSLIRFKDIGTIREALMAAFVASLAEPDEVDEDAEPAPLDAE